MGITDTSSWWLKPWQVLLQQTLALDPSFAERAQSLEGSVFLLNIENVTSFILTIQNRQLKILNAPSDSPADVCLTAPPFTLLRLWQGENTLLAHCDLQGDSRLLARWQQLFQATDLDWGEHLGRWFGVPLANVLEASAAAQHQAGKAAYVRFSEQLRDYFWYEGKILANPQEVTLLLNAIDALRDDLARFEQRLSLLEQAAGGKDA